MRRPRLAKSAFTPRFEQLEQRAPLAADFFLPSADHAIETAVVSDPAQIPPLTTLANTGYGWSDVSYVHNTYGLTGLNQTVAVIDSGIAWDQTAISGGFGPGYRVVGGYDFAEDDALPYDDGPAGYHGTHVTGIIGANDASNMGLAPQTDIVALRVFNDQGEGYFSWVEKALRWVHTNRNTFTQPITTVNLSMGAEWNASTLPNWATMEDELAMLKADGITVCIAAGNSFATYNSPGLSYPAVSPNVIPVASVNQAGNLSNYSQREQRVLAAPGEFIRSTVPDWFNGNDGIDYDWGVASGTSMATPYITGASLLVRQAMRQFGVTNITPDAVYNQLYNTADVIYDPATRANYHRVNLRRAIDTLAGADEYGNSGNTAFVLGTWQGARTIEGKTQTLGDLDCFTFTAGQTGALKLNLQSVGGQNVVWSGTFGGTLVGNQLTLNVIAGETYTVGVGGSVGSYQIRGELSGVSTPSIQATTWGSVDFRQINNVAVTGEQWYSFTATHTGTLTAEAFFQAARGNVDLELYSSTQQLLSASRSAGGSERVDGQVTAGQTYFLKVLGTNGSVNFRLTNLVSQSGGVLDVYGTSGVDSVVWNGVAANAFVLNGVSYSGFSSLNTINFHLGAGADSVTLLGASASESATLRAGSIMLASSSFTVSADDVETVRLYGQASDQVRFFDTAGNDLFDASSSSAMMRGAGYANYTEGFGTVSGHATAGGYDVAKLYDSVGNDTFEGSPSQATLRGPGFELTAAQFEAVVAIGGRGGSDTAVFQNPGGDGSFSAGTNSAVLQGPNYYVSAERFRNVRTQSAPLALANALDPLAADAIFANDALEPSLLTPAEMELLSLAEAGERNSKNQATSDATFGQESNWR